VLLDTHVWLWVAAGDEKRIGRSTRRAIERARTKGTLVVSVASMFEIAALSAAGRLRLSTSAESWMRKSIEIGNLQLAEITAAIAVEAGSIPAAALADPVDRLLVTTARALGVSFVTSDAAILAHITSSRVGRAIDASR
jgi:PIN domain nuclease of toxin-antitoxin system